jgi:hypothetical protein
VIGDGVQTVFSLHSSESRDSIPFVLQDNVVVVGGTLRARCLGLLFYQNPAYPHSRAFLITALHLRALHCVASKFSIKQSFKILLTCSTASVSNLISIPECAALRMRYALIYNLACSTLTLTLTLLNGFDY